MYDRGGSWDVSRKEGEHCKSRTIKGAGFPWQHHISYVEMTIAGRPPAVLQQSDDSNAAAMCK